MYPVVILEEALEDLKNIVGYVATENPRAAETLGSELLDAAMSLESLPYRGCRVNVKKYLVKEGFVELALEVLNPRRPYDGDLFLDEIADQPEIP
jgi:hypothetical protein